MISNNYSSPSFGMAFKQTAAVTDAISDFSARALKKYEKGADMIQNFSEKSNIGIDIMMGIEATEAGDKFVANLVSKTAPDTVKKIVYENFDERPRGVARFFRKLKSAIRGFSHFCNIKSKYSK